MELGVSFPRNQHKLQQPSFILSWSLQSPSNLRLQPVKLDSPDHHHCYQSSLMLLRRPWAAPLVCNKVPQRPILSQLRPSKQNGAEAPPSPQLVLKLTPWSYFCSSRLGHDRLGNVKNTNNQATMDVGAMSPLTAPRTRMIESLHEKYRKPQLKLNL